MRLPIRARRPDRRPRRRWRRFALAVFVLLVCAVGPGIYIFARCALTRVRPAATLQEPEDVRAAKIAIKGYYRAGSNTYLTLPEWFIVYNTEDYAALIARDRPSRFPYFGSIVDFWIYYRRVCDVSCALFPLDSQYHTMILIIGSSFAVENALKGIYENTVGRVAELVAGHDTDEDRFAARTAAEYGHFMHKTPWYEFPFASKLRALWTQTSASGPHLLRKWERRFALSAEYAIKAGYGRLIKTATKGTYGDEILFTYVRADHVPESFGELPIERVTELDDGSWLLSIERYEAFTPAAVALIGQGARVLDIAGNTRVLLTALTRGPIAVPADSRVLFARPLAAEPGRQRTAIDLPVGSLGEVVAALKKAEATLEHIYDF